MNLQSLAVSALMATGFVGWSIAAKFAGVSGAWAGLIAMSITTITVTVLGYTEICSRTPTLKGFIIMIILGVANGTAIHHYSQKVTDVQIPTALFVTSVSIFMVIITPLLCRMIYDKALTLDHGIGYLLALGAIYFLGK